MACCIVLLYFVKYILFLDGGHTMYCRFPAIILAFCGVLVGCSHLLPAQKAMLKESKEAL